jgi:hypothetical protein
LSHEFRFYGSVLLILIHDPVFSFLFRNSDCIEQSYCQYGRLRADIKLKSQDLKVQEEKVRATEEQRQNVLTRIINRLESIDGKCSLISARRRPLACFSSCSAALSCVISDSLDIISCFIIFFSSSNFFESVSSLSPIAKH